jgi:hypothetical protein
MPALGPVALPGPLAAVPALDNRAVLELIADDAPDACGVGAVGARAPSYRFAWEAVVPRASTFAFACLSRLGLDIAIGSARCSLCAAPPVGGGWESRERGWGGGVAVGGGS